MASEHTYYIPSQKAMYGTHAGNVELAAYLYATYMRLAPLDKDPAKVDGVSMFVRNGETHVRAVIQGQVIQCEVKK
jgi:hypothetical protein